MRKKEKNYAVSAVSIILSLCVICFIIDCTQYNPSFYTGYDILNPSAAVRANPLGMLETAEGGYEIQWDEGVVPSSENSYFIVDQNFINWVYELKEEIKRLR